MAKVCAQCHEKVSMAWFLRSSPDEKYRCVRCGSVIGFSKFAVPLSILIDVLDVIGIVYVGYYWEDSYNSLMKIGFSPLAIIVVVIFSLFGYFTALNFIKLFVPSKYILRMIQSQS